MRKSLLISWVLDEKLKKKPECLTSEVHHCPKSIETCQIKNNQGIPNALPSCVAVSVVHRSGH